MSISESQDMTKYHQGVPFTPHQTKRTKKGGKGTRYTIVFLRLVCIREQTATLDTAYVSEMTNVVLYLLSI